MTYPDIKLVYWAGGNPFHHHQDLNRLRKAFARVDTLVVHDLAWTASARHADFVLPCTMTLEREDIGSSQTDPLMVAMHQMAEPFGERATTMRSSPACRNVSARPMNSPKAARRVVAEASLSADL